MQIMLVTYDRVGAGLYDLSGEEPIRYVLPDHIEKPFNIKESRLADCKDKLLSVLANLEDVRSPLPAT